MSIRYTVLLLLTSLSLFHCTSRGPDPAAMKIIKAAGSQAMLTVIVEPKRWAKTRASLQAMLAQIPDQKVQQSLQAPDLYQAIRALAEAAGKTGWPAQLTGWDASRPIVAALFEPQVGDLVLAARSLLVLSPAQITSDGLPGIRSRILVPAIDSQALAGDLALLLGTMGLGDCSAQAGFFCTLPSGGGLVGLTAEEGWVRIEILTSEIPAGQHSWADRWQELRDQPVAAAKAIDSPAWRLAAGGRHLLAFHVRPWQLRDLASQINTGKIIEVLSMVEPAMRATMIAAGLAEVAGGYLLMSSEGAEMEDIALGWDFSQGLRLSYVAGLTPRGEQIIRAGLKSGKEPLAATGKDLLATVWSRIDLGAMLAAAGKLPVFAEMKKPQAMVQAIQEGGVLCPLHFALRSPMGLARSLLELIPIDIKGFLPRSMSMALTGLKLRPDQFEVQAAAALHVPANFDAALAQKGLAIFEKHTEQKVEMQIVGKEGQQLVYLSMGADAQKTFSKKIDAPSQVLSETRLNLKSFLASFLQLLSPQVQTTWSQLGPIQLRSELAGRVLLSQGLISLAGKEPMTWLDAKDYQAREWTSAAPSTVPSRGERCLAQITQGMRQAFHALASADPATKSLLLARATQELGGPLACALADPGTRAAALRTQLVLALFAAQCHQSNFDLTKELLVLDRACKDKHPEACARAQQARARPVVKLPEVAAQCCLSPQFGQPMLHVSAQANDIQADDDAGVSSLRPAPSGLGIDQNTPWQTAYAAIEKLEKKGIDQPSLMVRNPDQTVVGIKVMLPAGKQKQSKNLQLLMDSRKPIPLILRIHADQVELIVNGAVASFPHPKNCAPKKSCLDLKFIKLELLRLKSHLKDYRLDIYLDADAQIPFQQVATLLATAACLDKTRWDKQFTDQVTLGPVAKTVFEESRHHNLVPDTKRKPQQTVLGIIGSGIGIGSSAKKIKILPGKANIFGSLSKDIIRGIMRRERTKIRFCYERQLMKTPKLQGKIVISFVIDRTGKVKQAQVAKSTLANPPMEKCLLQVIKRMKFPAPKGGGVVKVNYPYHFNNGG